MPTFVICSCGAKLKVSDAAAGKTIACPKCKAHLKVPCITGATVNTETLSTPRTSTLGPTLLLRFTQLRQSTRQAYDLTGLGPSILGRLIAALILGGAFLLVILLASLLVLHLEPMYGFLLAMLAFLSVVIPSAVLVVWSPDATLEETRNHALAELRARHRARKELEPTPAATAIKEKVTEPKAIKRATTQECPYCAAEIPLRAVKCKHCGEFVDQDPSPKVSASAPSAQVQVHIHGRDRLWSPGVAAVLSFFIPGLGQIYKGQVINGLFWLIITAVGYLCLVPGIVLHLFCIIGAASGDPYRS